MNVNSTTISGKGIKGVKVGAYVNGKQIGKNTTVGINGTYKIKIPKRKLGTKVVVKISKSGYTISEKTVTVLNVFTLSNISVDKKVVILGEKVTITIDIRDISNLDIESIEVKMGG